MPRLLDWPADLRQQHSWLDKSDVPSPGSPWQQHPPAVFPPPGAVAYGRDVYGLWYDADLAGVLQRFRYMPSVLADDPSVKLGPAAVSEGFWLADTTCTQALWQAVTGKTPSRFEGDDLPVENVSWHDVQAFCAGLNTEHDRPQLHLPREAQWEYACRAGSDTAFWWGDSLGTEQANYDGGTPYDDGAESENREKTLPVKSFAPNPWGLYQVHGNVWEWCRDWYSEDISEMRTDTEGPDTGEQRVVRGGSWLSDGEGLRSARRFRSRPSLRDGFVGFRLSHPVPVTDENTAAKIRHAAKK